MGDVHRPRVGNTSGDHRGNTAAAVSLLAVLAFGAAFTWLGPVLRPFLVAVFLFYAVQSASKALARFGIGRTVSYFGLIAMLVVAATLLGQLIYRESGVFLGKWPKYERRIEAFLDRWHFPGDMVPGSGVMISGESRGVSGGTRPGTDEQDASGEPAPGSARKPPSLLRDFVPSGLKFAVDYVFRHSLEVAELLAMVLVYSIFLSVGHHRLPARIMSAFPGEHGERLLAIGDGITRSMEKFMAVKTIVGAGMAASAAVIMAAFGVDHWLLWTFLFFTANYVTYIGSMAACVPPIVLAFLDMKSPSLAIAVATLLVVNRLIWVDFVEVRMAGRELSLDPVLVFLWLAYWGWAWGLIGLLLAYPMLAAVKIVLSNVEGWEGWATLLGDR